MVDGWMDGRTGIRKRRMGNERLGVEIEMALKHVMLGRERERERERSQSQRRPSFERRAVYRFCISIHSLILPLSQSGGSTQLRYSEQPFPLALNWFASVAAIMQRDKIYREARLSLTWQSDPT